MILGHKSHWRELPVFWHEIILGSIILLSCIGLGEVELEFVLSKDTHFLFIDVSFVLFCIEAGDWMLGQTTSNISILNEPNHCLIANRLIEV
jgi:hypothetical protein